jgi:alpha-galactosidase
MNTRAVVAMSGTFGYELDLNLVSDEEKEEVKKQIALCKKYWDLTHEGKYYRLSNPIELSEYAAWQFASENKDEALLNVVTLQTHGNAPVNFVKLKGLDANAVYVEQESGKEYTGSALMNAGIPLPRPNAEYLAMQMHFVRK